MNTHAGEAWVHLNVSLGHPLDLPPPGHLKHDGRDGNARIRRRNRRAAQRMMNNVAIKDDRKESTVGEIEQHQEIKVESEGLEASEALNHSASTKEASDVVDIVDKNEISDEEVEIYKENEFDTDNSEAAEACKDVNVSETSDEVKVTDIVSNEVSGMELEATLVCCTRF